MTSSLFATARWLDRHRHDKNLQLIDARMLPPGTKGDITDSYRHGHLPDAPLFDMEQILDVSSPLPHMLPTPERFAVMMQQRGIGSDKHLVVYDEGNLLSAPRAWWMLNVFGARKVSILAGGLAGWQQAGYALQSVPVTLPVATFTLRYYPERLCSAAELLRICHDGSAQIVDARPAARFYGEVDEPRPGVRRGRIPGSLNVPWHELVTEDALKPDAELAAIFRRQGVDLSRPVIASCGSGVTAAVIILALTALGISNTRLYDGSWAEWGSSDFPDEKTAS